METVQQAPLQHVDPPQQLNVDPLQQLPINLGNIDNFLHHELPTDALINDAELAGPEPHLLGQPEEVDHLQVGMVRLIEEILVFLKPAVNLPGYLPWEKPLSKKKFQFFL